MTPGQIVTLVQGILTSLQKHCIDPTSGVLSLKSVSSDVAFGQDIEAAYKAAGGIIPANVDKVLAGAVAFAEIFGNS